MLSYMVPSIEEKPPPVPRLTNGHALVNGVADVEGEMLVPADTVRPVPKSSTLSTDSSASSLSSGVVGDLAPTHGDKPRHISNGGTKLLSHKRVSFGSSKGSMVETLVYESPVQEEPEVSPTPEVAEPDNSQSEVKQPSRVRVTFFDQEGPLVVSSPEPEILEDLDVTFGLVMTSPLTEHPASYQRQTSTDSGWDNPFRPDGDLSREADEIVELIKGGKPITPTPGSAPPPEATQTAPPAANGAAPTHTPVTATATKPAANSPAGAVELQRATVSPSDASQVEHVVLKKKPKCKCCVIQ